MASSHRFQIDDHFAAARARSQTAPPPRITIGRALSLLVLISGAAAGAWWWAMQPHSPIAWITGPQPTTVADRQAAVAAQLATDLDGRPSPGGRTPAQERMRVAAAPTGYSDADPAPATPAAATASPAASTGASPTPTRSAASRPAAQAAPADSGARGLAKRVNDFRAERAAHLRWLDACQKQHLVEIARAQLAQAETIDGRRGAQIAADNLAGAISTHQSEARRYDDLLGRAEQALADYCASHAVQPPELDNPPTTVSGVAAQPRPMPAATVRQTSGARTTAPVTLDPFDSGRP